MLYENNLQSSAFPGWFGSNDELFGWLHLPQIRTFSLGVVICSAYGHEELCTHRAVRSLANRLAQAGMPALRFDYAGSGDSLGDDADPDRVEAWLSSIDAAVQHLKKVAGVSRIALLGIRLGALLAGMAAARMGGIEALALLAPYSEGHAYVRDIRLRDLYSRQVITGLPSRMSQSEGVETGGFFFSKATLQTIEQLTLLNLTVCPAPNVLILTQHQVLSVSGLTEKLDKLGAEVTQQIFEGYTEFMCESNLLREPAVSWALVVQWLRDKVSELDESHIDPLRSFQLATFQNRTREEALFCDPRNTLFGILTHAYPVVPRPALILLNFYTVHHIGNCRFSVQLARHFALYGFSSLRFDMAGLGDSSAWSEQEEDQKMNPQELQRDIKLAMDALSERGFRSFVLIGLCYSATLAYLSAHDDSRVCGVVLLNALELVQAEELLNGGPRHQAFRTIRFYRQSVSNWKTWKRLLTGEIDLLPHARALIVRLAIRTYDCFQRIGLPIFWTQNRDKVDRVQNFYALLDRGIEILIVYSMDDTGPGLAEFQIYYGIKGSKLSKRRNFRFRLLEGSDHTFSQRSARKEIVQCMEQYLESFKKHNLEKIRSPIEVGK